MNKKIIIILIILPILLGIFSYFFLFRKQETEKTPPIKTSKEKGGNLELELVIQEKIYFPALSLGEKSIIYRPAKETGFKKLSLIDRKNEATYEAKILPTIKAFWSPNKNQVLFFTQRLETLEDQENEFLRYDFEKKELSSLNKNIIEAIWALDGNKIIYHYWDMEKNQANLSMSDPDGKNWKILTELKQGEYGFGGWLDKRTLVYFENPTDVSGTNIYSIDIETKGIKQLSKDKSTKEAEVSPDGNKIAYEAFHQDKENYTLALMNTDGSGKKDLGITSNGFNKLVWLDNKIIFLASRENNDQSDKFYKINTDTGEKTEIPYDDGGAQIDAQNLMPTRDGKTLYFTSDDLLYKMELGNP